MKASRRMIKEETTFAAEVLHSLNDFNRAIAAGEPITLRKVKLNLHPRLYSAADIQALRRRMGVSQALFGQLIAVSVDLVQKWESGKRQPQPVHCRLLDEVARNPDAWMKRVIGRAEENLARISA